MPVPLAATPLAVSRRAICLRTTFPRRPREVMLPAVTIGCIGWLLDASEVVDDALDLAVIQSIQLRLHLLGHGAFAFFEELDLLPDVVHLLSGQDTGMVAGEAAVLAVAGVALQLVDRLAFLH